MKVLVLGGTGAIGGPLVELAASQGHQVYVTSRKREDVAGAIRYLKGNAHDDIFLGEVLSQPWDAIVDFMVYGTQAFHRRLELLLGRTGHYFFLSSARVYAEGAGLLTEDSPRLLDVSPDRAFLATDEYALAKARQENLVRDSGRCNWTIVRPYITYAPERLQLGVLEKEGWLYRALQGRSIVLPGEVSERMTTLTSGRDVAAAICALVGRPRAMGETFHITAPRAQKWSTILGIYLEVLGKHLDRVPRVVQVGTTEFLRGHASPYQLLYDRGFDRRFDSRKIAGWVDVAKFQTAEEGVKASLEAFLQAPAFRGIDWRSEAVKDALARERSKLSELAGLRTKLSYIVHRYLKN